MFVKLRRVPTDMIPGSFGTNEYVHFNLHARVAVDTAERYTVNLPIVYSAQRGSAGTTEAQPPPRCRFIFNQIFLSTDPKERARRDF
jgi:hypothetical protein